MSYTPSGPWVLDFPGTADAILGDARGHIWHGPMWGVAGLNLGNAFWWETWIMPRQSNSTWWLADGGSGEHSLLLGFSQSSPTAPNYPELITYDGSVSPNVLGDEGVLPGTWAHIVYAWGADSGAAGQKKLFVYINGIPVGYTNFNGPRQSKAPTASGGDLYIGGSDHSNFDGRIAQVRGFDQFCPVSYMQQAFTPESIFGGWSYDNAGNYTACDFLARYTVPNELIIPDCSPGGYYVGGNPVNPRIFHPGALYGAYTGGSRGFPTNVPSTYPGPRWVVDETCPFAGPSAAVPAGYVPSPVRPTPSGAILFDNFDRAQSVPAFEQTPSLGTAVVGGAWTTGLIDGLSATTSRWGLMNGRAVPVETQLSAHAWLDAGTATQDVRVTRPMGSAGLHHTGLVFRHQDRNNYWWIYTNSETAANPTLYMALILAGVGTVPQGEVDYVTISTVAVPNWTRLRVTASGTTITVYVGVENGTFDANGFPNFTWTQVKQLTGQTNLQSATHAGIAGVQYNANWVSSLFRHDDFEVR